VLVFNPGLAKGRVQILELDQITDLLLVTHAPDRVAAYRAAMQAGEAFPPISVVRLAGYYLIADGHKRFAAYSGWRRESIPVEIWTWRRWAQDQWRQFNRRTRRQLSLTLRSPFDANARREAICLGRSTVTHWRRIAVSLAHRVSRRDAPQRD
jgi:hypothetical protein